MWPPRNYRTSRWSEDWTRTFLIAAAIAVLASWAVPSAGAIRWLALRRAVGIQWNASTCRSGRVRWGLSARQAALCKSSSDAMPQLSRAAQQTIATCQHLFANRRWNCSSVEAAPLFTPDLTTGTREQAFVYALSSAAASHSLARACAQGTLFHCSCAGPPREPPNGNFKWGGCGDNVRYGLSFGKQFADAAERKSSSSGARRAHWALRNPPPTVTSSKRRKSVDVESRERADESVYVRRKRRRRHGAAQLALVNMHNNRAGRRAVEASVVTQCKCHGVSGSCNIKTCWKALPRLEDIGQRLQRRFGFATEVVSRRSVASGRRLVPAPAGPGVLASASTSYSEDDLIFLNKSPDYCIPDKQTGSQGTHYRTCNATSGGFDSCEDMCCGRGYRTISVERIERCQCKYYWCCYVRCKICRTWVDIHECL